MGEIFHRSFGNRINWNDDTDPLVREVKLLSHSPAWWPRRLLEKSQRLNWTREDIRIQLQDLNIAMAQRTALPGSADYIHRQWLDSLEEFKRETFDFREASPAETDAAVRPIKHDIHDQVSTTLDAPPKADVIPFPGTASFGVGTTPPPSSPPA